MNQSSQSGKQVGIRRALHILLGGAHTSNYDYTPFPRFPMSRPATGHEGKLLNSLPAHRMVYSDRFGEEGVEIETPEGMVISFGGKQALERFISEMNISAEDGEALRAIDARADLVRNPHGWTPGLAIN
jgi:hypothetical protein